MITAEEARQQSINTEIEARYKFNYNTEQVLKMCDESVTHRCRNIRSTLRRGTNKSADLEVNFEVSCYIPDEAISKLKELGYNANVIHSYRTSDDGLIMDKVNISWDGNNGSER